MKASCLALMLALSACGTTIVADPAFPVMSPAQVEAMGEARAAYPALDEWWVRFVKAWQKSDTN